MVIEVTDSSRGADKSLVISTSRFILFDGENFSFDASLILFINSIINAPIRIINRIYEHQNFCRCSLFPSCSG